MNKDTKKPTEKVLLCRKSATPTVANFAKTKVNEIEKYGAGEESRVEDRQDRKRNKEGKDWYGDGGVKKNHMIWSLNMQNPVILLFQANALWF